MDTNTAASIDVCENIPPVQLCHASRRRRILAFLTDTILLSCVLTVIFIAVACLAIASDNLMLIFLIVPIAIIWHAVIVLRDVIFGKASIGKRILGIKVVAKDTGEPATKKARAIRGFSSFILFFDFLFLLFSRKSLGDRLGDTAVVYTRVNESMTEDGIVVSSPVKRGGGLAIITVILSLVIMISAIVVDAEYSFDLVSQKEEYALAVEYIVESPYFETLDTPKEKLDFTGYNYSIKNGITTAEFTFRIEGKSFTDTIVIVCVKENDTWQVNETLSKGYRDKQ